MRTARTFIHRAVVIILAVSFPMSVTSRSHRLQLAECSETVPNSLRVETSRSSTAKLSSYGDSVLCSQAENCVQQVEIDPISDSCYDVSLREFCGSILAGPTFCVTLCGGTLCIHQDGAIVFS
jgi:hypothetical protein